MKQSNRFCRLTLMDRIKCDCFRFGKVVLLNNSELEEQLIDNGLSSGWATDDADDTD